MLDAADEALDLAPEERVAFIERCCADDPGLGAELKALLAGADAASILESPAAAFAGPILDELGAGPDPADSQSRFGPYRIVRELGRGGMGAVYLAERSDDQYQTRVALKLLPSWSGADERRVQRFLEERQILAALDHPDIARLLDGGVTPGGLPWFAMQYVEGVPIDRYCDELRLSIEGRLELFCRVCATVAYAHRNLVVHRDLKPANILVTADGRVSLLDFGIAKLLGSHPATAAVSLTVTGERLLTPLYASPEQVRGDPVSTATDVYALGVLLHVVLTGSYPYRLSSWQQYEVVRAVLEQEPERPSVAILRGSGAPHGDASGAPPEQVATARGSTPAKLGRRLRGDLDAIVLKAMEKDPTRRYGSAEQLEADVQRHLAGLPVAARPAGRLYQAGKFLRRHRIGVAATAAVTLLVLGFALVTAVQSTRIRAQAERIALERDRAEEVARYLANLFETSTPSPRERRGVTTREVLDSAAARIEGDLSRQPDTRARLMFEMGRAYLTLGLPERAQHFLEASLALRRSLSSSGSRDVAATLDLLGAVLLEQGQLERAERTWREALALRRRLLGSRHGDVARTLNGLAAVLRAQGRARDAESVSREALAIDRARPGDNRVDVAQSLRGVADALLDRGDYAGAESLYRQALSLLRAKLPEEHPDVAGTVLHLGAALKGTGQKAAADSLLRYGLALYRRLAVAPPAPWDFGLQNVIPPKAGVGPRSAVDSKIAFTSDRDGPDPVGHLGNHEIYVMNADGTDQRRLTNHDAMDELPAWSPDGKRIAFSSRRGGGGDIFLMDADGTQPARLTNLTEMRLYAFHATWSLDGKRIAFQSFVRPDIFVINEDGTGLTNLTNHPARDGLPDWSPDGRKIAFVSDRDGTGDVYVMNVDGTEPVRLTFNAASHPGPGWGLDPDWSPDGRKIAFVSDRDGDQEIYVMNADGTNPVRLTVNPGEDGFPSWSPDGKMLAFHRRVLGHRQVFVM
ncbi:MAG: protein kinase domain-containing protein, partial [Gemmatimonadales bacterium]